MSLEIGLRLKEARESLGLTIQDIRDRTRIESGYLIALENGEFDKLPSPYFVRTCIRAYAKCVGIEPHHLLKKYHPIPGDSGASDSSNKRNTGRQRAVQDRSRITSTFPRLSSQDGSPDASGEERERQETRSGLERTMRMDSLTQKTNPNLGAGFSSAVSDSFDEGPESQYLPQPISTRSRRSERVRESLTSRKIRRVALVAGVALFIPVAAWGAVSLLRDDPAAEPSRTTVQQQSESEGVNAAPLSSPEGDSTEEGTSEVTLVDNSGGIAHYQTTAAGDLLVEIGPVTDICWVQIREIPEGGKSYLKDVTLRNNEVYRYEHPADGSSDLYIEFGAPHAVQQIKVNGQPISSSKMIHIKRAE